MSKFAMEERKKLLKNGFYVFYRKGTAIFHQGDVGDYMYIILKGAVGVRVKSNNFGSEPIIVATLREGDHVGEWAVISDNKEKSTKQKTRINASCICSEDTHGLGSPSTAVDEVVTELINSKLKGEIDIFHRLDYLSDIKAS